MTSWLFTFEKATNNSSCVKILKNITQSNNTFGTGSVCLNILNFYREFRQYKFRNLLWYFCLNKIIFFIAWIKPFSLILMYFNIDYNCFVNQLYHKTQIICKKGATCKTKQGDFDFALESTEGDFSENFAHFAWFGKPFSWISGRKNIKLLAVFKIIPDVM